MSKLRLSDYGLNWIPACAGKASMIMAVLVMALMVPLQAQTYYNLKYKWNVIEDAVTTVKDSLASKLAGKLDNDVKLLEVSANSGVSTIINLPVTDAPANSRHGYILAIDNKPVMRLSGWTELGDTINTVNVAINTEYPDTNYVMSVNGTAIAERWDVTGADFAEWFKTSDDTQLQPGTTVVIDNGLVRAAGEYEAPFGVVTRSAGYVGNNSRPHDKYLGNGLGDTLTTTVPMVRFKRAKTLFGEVLTDSLEVNVPLESFETVGRMDGLLRPAEDGGGQSRTTVELPAGAEIWEKKVAVQNPDYGTAVLPRAADPEYVLIGLLGQVAVRKGQPTASNWIYIKELSSEADLWLVR